MIESDFCARRLRVVEIEILKQKLAASMLRYGVGSAATRR